MTAAEAARAKVEVETAMAGGRVAAAASEAVRRGQREGLAAVAARATAAAARVAVVLVANEAAAEEGTRAPATMATATTEAAREATPGSG